MKGRKNNFTSGLGMSARALHSISMGVVEDLRRQSSDMHLQTYQIISIIMLTQVKSLKENNLGNKRKILLMQQRQCRP